MLHNLNHCINYNLKHGISHTNHNNIAGFFAHLHCVVVWLSSLLLLLLLLYCTRMSAVKRSDVSNGSTKEKIIWNPLISHQKSIDYQQYNAL